MSVWLSGPHPATLELAPPLLESGGISADVKEDISCLDASLRYQSWFDSTECAQRSYMHDGSSAKHCTSSTRRPSVPTHTLPLPPPDASGT